VLLVQVALPTLLVILTTMLWKLPTASKLHGDANTSRWKDKEF
jgi:hypothetical protein